MGIKSLRTENMKLKEENTRLREQIIDSMLDAVYNNIDDMLLAGKFSTVDNLLISTDCDKHSVDMLLALLTITYAARQHLPHRQEFYTMVEKSIRDRGEWEDGLLYGLE